MTYSPPDLNWHHATINNYHSQHLETRIYFSGNQGSNAWPANNLCLYIPIYVLCKVVAYSLFWINGSTVSGNACMGLYDEGGNRIAQTGVVAQAVASYPQEPSITAFELAPGRYWAGLALSTTAGTVRACATPTPGTDANRWLSMGEETVASTQVPTTMSPSTTSRGFVPCVGIRTIPQAL